MCLSLGFQVFKNGLKDDYFECGDNTHEYTYDARGLQEGRTEAANTPIARTTVTRWDTRFRLPDEIITPQLTTKFTYDDKANLIAKTESSNSDTRTWHYQYNAQGLLTDINDPLNHHTHYEYDDAGDLIKIINALDQVTEITRYNADGLPLEIKNPNNVVTELKYDARGRLASYQTANQLTQLSYDKAGNLTQITKPSGAYLHYAYDEAHRLKEIEDNLHNKIIYTLDALGHPTFEKVINPTGQLTWQEQNLYDKLAQLTANIGGTYQETSYTYDANSNVNSMQDGLDYKTSYVVDALNRIIKVELLTSHNSYTLANNITYLPFGPIAHLEYGNGIKADQKYDLDYRLLEQVFTSGTIASKYGYYWDLNDQLKQTSNSAYNQNFNYDVLGRLLSASSAGNYGTFTYTYDANNNRLTQKINTNTETYTYAGNSNQLLTIKNGTEEKNYTYTATGNIKKISSNNTENKEFVYNFADQLSQIIQGTTYTQYYYNGLGQRVHANVGAAHYYYIYDQTGNRIAEQDNQGNIRDYIYLNDQPLAVVEHSSTQPVTAQHIYYYQLDQRQTPVQLTDSNRAVVWQGSYQPFGIVDQKKTTIKNNLRLPGQYADQATGYYYNYFRDYDPAIGRYLEVDPIGLTGGINPYGYAGQNPNNNIDPTGLLFGGIN